ncbi:MAG: hypothetical protein V1866_02425 [archaeon]
MSDFDTITLSVLIGTLAAIVYTLRMVVLMNEKLDKLMSRGGMSNK